MNSENQPQETVTLQWLIGWAEHYGKADQKIPASFMQQVAAALRTQQPVAQQGAALPEQIADETVKVWQAADKMPPMAFDFRGLIADGIRRAQPDTEPRGCEIFSNGEWVQYPQHRYEEAKVSGHQVRLLYALRTQQPVAQQGAAYTLTNQQIIDRFDFLEGLVSEGTFNQITDAAKKIHAHALRTQQPVPAAAAGIPGNFITHRAAWRNALETAKAHATGEDVSYWVHEIAAFDRSFDRLWALMQPSPTPQADSAPSSLNRPSSAWYRQKIQETLDDDFQIGPAPKADSQPAVDESTPGEWFVRKLVKDGKVVDCFVAAPDYLGIAYDAEILGDDEYRNKPESDEISGIRRKLADCELIVAAVKQYRAARAPADSVLEDAARDLLAELPLDFADQIKACANHWAQMARIDNDDQAEIEKQRHAALVDGLARYAIDAIDAARKQGGTAP